MNNSQGNPFVGFDVFVKQDESIATLIADANEMGEAFREGSISEEEYRVGSQHLRKRFSAFQVAHINATGYEVPNEERFSVEDSLTVPWQRYSAGDEEYEPPPPGGTPRTPLEGDRSGLAGLGPNYPDERAEIPVQNNQTETEGRIDKMSNPFVGFETFRKQYDPDNPTAESLGLTSGSTRTPMDTNIGQNVPDPAADMGELPKRPGRLRQMHGRMKRGKEAFPGEAERHRDAYGGPADPEDDVSDEQLVSMYQRYSGLSPEEAAAQVNVYRTQQREYVPLEEMTQREAEANLQREAGLGGEEYSPKAADGFVKALDSFINFYEGENNG